jgi:hypothetical protein
MITQGQILDAIKIFIQWIPRLPNHKTLSSEITRVEIFIKFFLIEAILIKEAALQKISISLAQYMHSNLANIQKEENSMKKTWISAFSFVILMFTTVAGTTPVPDTGQSKCYNSTVEITCPSTGQAFYGQDANYTINPMSYTKLDGNGNVLPHHSTSWVMVRDNVTGLIWEVKNNLDGVSNYGNPHDADNSYTWYDPNDPNPGTSGSGTDTKDFIDALNSAYFGSYCDWRMPTVKELAYIVNYNIRMPGPTIDTNYFPNTKAAVYWSSTAYVDSGYFAWGVNFYYSDDYNGAKSLSYYARAVRSGYSEHSDLYVDNNDGTVTNKTNGLMWQQITPVDKKTWEQAYLYCETLSLATYTDWRLPTQKELRSIVDYGRVNPAINPLFLPFTFLDDIYWSSTTDTYATNRAWGIRFVYGNDVYGSKRYTGFISGEGSYYVRAVRGGQLEDWVISVSPVSRDVTKDAGATTFSVSNTGTGAMPWTAAVTSGGSWLSIASGASGSNAGTITCKFDANTDTSARAGVIRVTAAGATGSPVDVTVTQASTLTSPLVLFSNSIGSRNTIKISDMSGTLPASGSIISVNAWDYSGTALIDSGSAALRLNSHGTTTISGPDLAARFLNGTPMLYKFSIDSPKVVVTNLKNSTNDTFKVPIVYLSGVTDFVSNSIGSRNTVKVSDISGTLPASGSTISVKGWDANGNALTESGSAAPLKINNHGTTRISGTDLAARFPTGSPVIYEFVVQSAKALITNVESSTDGNLNIPVAYTIGMSNFVSNSIGDNNTLEISDLSAAIPSSGGAITVLAWDVSGTALSESGSAAPLKVDDHGTTRISGLDMAKRFPAGTPMTYEFSIDSSKVLITNVKSSTDGHVEIPSIFTIGVSNFATNYVSSLNTIKISDTSGILSAGGVAISITAWDTNGNAVLESGSAVPLKLHNLGTTIISGSDLAERFPSGFPKMYEFSIGSPNAIVTNLMTSVDGTIKTPTVFTIGSFGGI